MQKTLLERDRRERNFFDKLAKDRDEYWGWSTKIGEYRRYFRAQLIVSKLKLKKGVKVLEIGCSYGGITEHLCKSGARIISIDISSKAIEVARKKINSKNVSFKKASAHQIPFKNNYFDAVVGNAILHHLEVDIALEEIKRVLKNKGHIFFVEPNLLNPEIFLERKVNFFRKISKSSVDETAFIRWNIAKKIKQHGFIKITTTPFDFLYPAIPYIFFKPAKTLAQILEKTPLIKEFAGSLIIKAQKP